MVYMLSLELFESKINIVHHTFVFSLLAKDKISDLVWVNNLAST